VLAEPERVASSDVFAGPSPKMPFAKAGLRWIRVLRIHANVTTVGICSRVEAIRLRARASTRRSILPIVAVHGF
jgi:hypothetical protein